MPTFPLGEILSFAIGFEFVPLSIPNYDHENLLEAWN